MCCVLCQSLPLPLYVVATGNSFYNRFVLYVYSVVQYCCIWSLRGSGRSSTALLLLWLIERRRQRCIPYHTTHRPRHIGINIPVWLIQVVRGAPIRVGSKARMLLRCSDAPHLKNGSFNADLSLLISTLLNARAPAHNKSLGSGSRRHINPSAALIFRPDCFILRNMAIQGCRRKLD